MPSSAADCMYTGHATAAAAASAHVGAGNERTEREREREGAGGKSGVSGGLDQEPALCDRFIAPMSANTLVVPHPLPPPSMPLMDHLHLGSPDPRNKISLMRVRSAVCAVFLHLQCPIHSELNVNLTRSETAFGPVGKIHGGKVVGDRRTFFSQGELTMHCTHALCCRILC